MPELAEVLLTADCLKQLKGLECKSIELLSGKVSRKNKEGFNKLKKQLPFRIKNTGSRGKFIWIEIWKDDSNNDNLISYIGFHLGLVGRLRVVENRNLGDKYDHVIFTFTDKKYLIFNDYRNFGNIYLRTTEEHRTAMKKIGVPLNKLIDWKHFRDILKDARKGNKLPIARVLLMQELVSGIGNYMRNDGLYHARISPHRLKGTLTNVEYKKIYNGLIKVYQWAQKCQVKEPNYKKTNFTIYRQKQDSLGNDIIKESLSGRSIFWVPSLQN